MFLWGALDIGYLIVYAMLSIQQGQIPVLTSLEASLRNGFEVLAIPFAIVLTVFLISFIYSGWALMHGRISGVYVAYAQIPFRIVWVIPSFFPLIWLPRILPWHTRWDLLFMMGTALLVSETTKVILLRRSRRRLLGHQ